MRAAESQIPIMIEGFMGDLNLGIDGLTADFIGVTWPIPYRRYRSVNAIRDQRKGHRPRQRGEALGLPRSTGKKLTGGKAYSGNSLRERRGLGVQEPVEHGPVNRHGHAAVRNMTRHNPERGSNAGQQTRTCTCSALFRSQADRIADLHSYPAANRKHISTAGLTVTASATNPGGRATRLRHRRGLGYCMEQRHPSGRFGPRIQSPS